jgi:hypothetical protein
MEALFGLLVESLVGFRGQGWSLLGAWVSWAQCTLAPCLLDVATLRCGLVLQLTRQSLGVLGGLYVDACHPGVRVFLELFGLSCDAASRLCVPITCLWPVFGQGVCLSCVLGVRCTPLGFICMVFGSGFPYKLDHVFSCKLNTMTSSSPACSQKKCRGTVS